MKRSTLYCLALGVLSLCLGGSTAFAAKVKVWSHHAPADYDKAQLRQAVVSSEGAVRLSRLLKPFAGLDASHVWAVVEGRDDTLYAATGDEGKIYKLTPDGKAAALFRSENNQILCLAAAPDGSVYAGTGPGGQIVHIDPKGVAKVLYASPEQYVWSLAVDPRGEAVYAGTGPKGRVYRVTPDGKGSVFYQTKQEHVLCVAAGADGSVYAGTDKQGLVYRIDPRGKGFVIFSAPQAEVRTLAVAGDAVYAGTSSPRNRRGPGGSTAAGGGSPPGSAGSGGASPTTAPKAKPPSEKPGDDRPGEGKANDGKSGDGKTGNGKVTLGPASGGSDTKEPARGSPAAAPAPPGNGENSLYRIAKDGTVRELFRAKALVLCQLRQDGRLLVGTGLEGRLFEVDEASKECTEIARLDHGQVLCLCKRRDGSVVLGTGDPGKLYLLQDKYTARGTVTSDVLDAKLISKWGALRWKADAPAGTAVTVAVRSGNVAEPDETWSDWSAEQTDPRQAVIAAPPARFLQYRVTLASKDAALTPVLRGLTLRYATTNQAPEVTGLEVPDLDAANLADPKKVRLRWNATDANEDELTFSVWARKEGWTNWVLLEDGLDKKEFEWDTTTTPSGTYRIKVVASDRKDNPEEEALTGEKVSAPFTVSHVPATVALKVVGMEGDQAVIEATASHPAVRLVSASFAVNGKKWVPVFPADGLFDSRTEAFRFKTDSLRPGSYVVVLKVRDAAGNTGSGDVVFAVQAKGGR